MSLRLTVDLGMPSSAAAFDRLRHLHHLAEYQQGVDVEGQVLFHGSGVPNMQQGVAVLHLF